MWTATLEKSSLKFLQNWFGFIKTRIPTIINSKKIKAKQMYWRSVNWLTSLLKYQVNGIAKY